MSPDDLLPYEKNIRKHTESDLAIIKKSIKDYDFQDPVVVDKDMTIIEGHGRVMAAKALGLKKIPVIISDLTGQKADEYRVVHNKTGEIAGYDMDIYDSVINELVEKGKFDAEGYLFALPEVDEKIFEPPTADEPDEPKPDIPEYDEDGEGGRLMVYCETREDLEDAMALLSGLPVTVKQL